MTIEKKLGVWGKDKSEGEVYAKNYYCVECYRKKEEIPAVVFWPAFDPDIRSSPYCRPCVDELKLKAMIDLFEED